MNVGLGYPARHKRPCIRGISNRKKPTTPLEVLRERLRNARPPSISILLSFFQNVETYNDFVKLVREYLPEREKEILEKPTPHEQMACFASHFEDRYLPLHPIFKDESAKTTIMSSCAISPSW